MCSVENIGPLPLENSLEQFRSSCFFFPWGLWISLNVWHQFYHQKMQRRKRQWGGLHGQGGLLRVIQTDFTAQHRHVNFTSEHLYLKGRIIYENPHIVIYEDVIVVTYKKFIMRHSMFMFKFSLKYTVSMSFSLVGYRWNTSTGKLMCCVFICKSNEHINI